MTFISLIDTWYFMMNIIIMASQVMFDKNIHATNGFLLVNTDKSGHSFPPLVERFSSQAAHGPNNLQQQVRTACMVPKRLNQGQKVSKLPNTACEA